MKISTNISGFVFLIMYVLVMAVSSCSKDSNNLTVLTTKPVVGSGTLLAYTGGVIQSYRGVVSQRGVVWSVNPNPTTSDNFNYTLDTSASFSLQIYYIMPNTTYYVRAYATNDVGTTYGNQQIFRRDTVVNTFNPLLSYGSVSDIDGNSYKTIQIGTQTWMAENLRVTHYRNGNEIPNITSFEKWPTLKSGAYCIYENASGMNDLCGKFYNWYSVHDARNIAPVGWHVPTQAEVNTMVSYLGGDDAASKKLLKGESWNWVQRNTVTEGNNESGFTALPGGVRISNNVLKQYQFFDGLVRGWWWCADQWENTTWGIAYSLPVDPPVFVGIAGLAKEKEDGLSVRCVKD